MSGEIINKWEFKIAKSNPTFPFVVVDNWYTPNEEKAVWKELDYYSSLPKDNIHRAEDTIVARHPDGKSKSNAYRFYINEWYTETGKKRSAIQNCMYKQRLPEFHNILNIQHLVYH